MYPGGKNACYQRIINLIPPHRVYIETHLGSGAIMANKRPAELNIGIELNRDVLAETAARIAPSARIVELTPGVSLQETIQAGLATDGDGHRWLFVHGDARQFLTFNRFGSGTFIYLDPPYVLKTRSTGREIYEYEYTDDDHRRLLTVLLSLRCRVMISGYWSELYEDMLANWHTYTYDAITRGGSVATEWLWMNYPRPQALHDYRYLGDDYRERERIKRKRQRWVNRLRSMDQLERQTILWAIEEAGLLQYRQA